MTIRQVRMVVIDVETGGLNPERDALLSIGAVDSQTREHFYGRMRPPESLHLEEAALNVNGFERKAIYDPALESESVVMSKFYLWLADCQPVVIAGCNVKFDIAFINAAFARNEADVKVGIKQMLGHRAFDLQSLALTAYVLGALELPIKHDLPSTSFDSILSAVGLSRIGKYHTADEDATLTLNAIELIMLNLTSDGMG